jgi:UrcA family protein
MSRYLFAVLAAAACLASPLSASAQTTAERTSISVFYGDLDLAKPAGMQTLLGRLKAASLQVCGNSRGELRVTTSDPARCAQDAVANALAAIGKAQNRMLANNERTR